MKRSTALTVIPLILLLLIVFAAALLTQKGEPAQPYDPNSTQGDGLRLLRLWLEELGYQVDVEPRNRFLLPTSETLLLIYPGRETFSAEEAEELQAWIKKGGDAALINVIDSDTALADAFASSNNYTQSWDLNQVQPLLPDNQTTLASGSYASTIDLSAAPLAVPILVGEEGGVTLAVTRYGNGTLWFLTSHLHLTNLALLEPEKAKIVLALLRNIPDGGNIWIDTYHLFGPSENAERIESLQGWLYYTPYGQALLFALVCSAIYLFFQGRRLGPPLPERQELRRREAAEYVQAMASLHRRAHTSNAVGDHQRRRLKRALGRPLHVSPDLEDGEFVRRLRAVDPLVDEARAMQITALLTRLKSGDETTLVHSAAEVEELVRRR